MNLCLVKDLFTQECATSYSLIPESFFIFVNISSMSVIGAVKC